MWETHQALKIRLIDYRPAARLAQQAERRGEPPDADRPSCSESLDPDALTIGFARRFATYKRADLVLQDIETLAADRRTIPTTPMQFMFAGKAHPPTSPARRSCSGSPS